MQDKLVLGNLDAKRDWGFAPEYCEGMWRILQYKNAEDFVLATGETRTVRQFVDLAFRELGIELEFVGVGENERGVVKSVSSMQYAIGSRKSEVGGRKSEVGGLESEVGGQRTEDRNPKSAVGSRQSALKTGDVVVEVSPGYYRPTEVELLIGDAAKARELLGWEAKTSMEELVKIMVKADLEKTLRRGF